MADNLGGKDDKMISEKFKIGLRKMIKSFDKYIKEAADFEQLEENLKHMEETDERFHKYDLVEILRDKIESALGEPVDRIVNEAFSSSKFDGDIDVQNKLAHTICTDLMKTKEFAEFKSSFKSSVERSNEQLMKNFNANFFADSSNSEHEVNFLNDSESKSMTMTNDFEYLSLDNSLNQTSFVFFTSEQLPVIALNLDQKNVDQVRLRALHQLLSIPASDAQAAEHWIEIRKYLNSALRDSNPKIADLCLKLHSRTLASSHYKVSVEIYINLSEHLSEYFRDRELAKRLFKTTVDLVSPENHFLLKIVIFSFSCSPIFIKNLQIRFTILYMP